MKILKPDYYTKFVTILGFTSIIAQIVISKLNIYNSFLEYTGYVIGMLLLFLGNINHFGYYEDKYKIIKSIIPIKKLFLLVILLICFNAITSGVIAYFIDKNQIIQGIIDSYPWTVLHGLVSSISMVLFYLLIIKVSNSKLKVKYIISIALVSYLLAGVIFTPFGTLCYFMNYQGNDEILVILYKSFYNSISLGVLSAFLIDLILCKIEEDKVRKVLLSNLEYIIGFISFSIYLIFYISFIGNFIENNKKLLIILYAILFYCMYYSIFHISLHAIIYFRSNINRKPSNYTA